MTARMGGPRQRTVLAALLLRANRTASIDYLTRAAWENPPMYPESNLRTYITGLRRKLRESGTGDGRLLTRPHGYSLLVRPDELDVACFEELAARGGHALDNSDFATAAQCFRRALSLWRGQPLEGQQLGPVLQAEITRLQERRFTVVEQYCQACRALGEYTELIGDLRWLVDEHPLREELWAQLMEALHTSGRQAEALEVFRQVRTRLVGELGIEPGERLQRLHQKILTAPAVRSVPAPTLHSGWRGHRELPMDVNDFTGRHDELASLRALVDAAGAGPPADTIAGPPADTIAGPPAGATAATVCVIEGPAGVGKTRLAIHAAHQLGRDSRFDELQLWADLHGFDPQHAAADPATVLEKFLYSLGVPGSQIPPDLEDRARLYRDKLSGRRALVLLDDATDEDQVRPLLPGAPGCLVLITARRSLGGLDGVLSLVLDVFPRQDAVCLFSRIVGADRVAAERDAAARIVRSCGYLPLAIALAARRVRIRRSWTLAGFADRLGQDGLRLDSLNCGTQSVQAAFEQSYRALPAEQRRLFRLLSLHPGADFSPGSAGVLVDRPPAATEIQLDALLDAYLLEQRTAGRYRFHDLVRDFARECTLRDDTAAERDAATSRLLSWYLYAADASTGTRFPVPG